MPVYSLHDLRTIARQQLLADNCSPAVAGGVIDRVAFVRRVRLLADQDSWSPLSCCRG